MHSDTESLLLGQVAPRLRAAIPKTVAMVSPDDPNELLQDGLAIAVVLIESAKRNGKKVSAGNIAHYYRPGLTLRPPEHRVQEERHLPPGCTVERPRPHPIHG